MMMRRHYEGWFEHVIVFAEPLSVPSLSFFYVTSSSAVTDLHFFIFFPDAQRALELLQQYRAKLDHRQQNQSRAKQGLVEQDQQLHQSLDRVINVFQSQLFNALLGEDPFFSCTI